MDWGSFLTIIGQSLIVTIVIVLNVAIVAAGVKTIRDMRQK